MSTGRKIRKHRRPGRKGLQPVNARCPLCGLFQPKDVVLCVRCGSCGPCCPGHKRAPEHEPQWPVEEPLDD